MGRDSQSVVLRNARAAGWGIAGQLWVTSPQLKRQLQDVRKGVHGSRKEFAGGGCVTHVDEVRDDQLPDPLRAITLVSDGELKFTGFSLLDSRTE